MKVKTLSNKVITVRLIYEILMISLSVLIVILSILNLFYALSPSTNLMIKRADLILCGVFAIDLILRLIFAHNKVKCLKESLLTIFMVIPFATLFKIAGIFRLNSIFLLIRFPSVGIGISTGIGGLLLRIWYFFMTPAVIRISKFFNLARTYFIKHGNSED